jgi:hypothetical protein
MPGDDDVVVDGYAKQPTNLGHLLGHLDISLGWRGVARRVIVHEDAAGGV